MSNDPAKPERSVKSPDDKPLEGDAPWRTASRLRPRWTGWHSASLVLVVLFTGAAGVGLPPHAAFLMSLLFLTIFTTIAGHGVVGLWLGLLIDERNRMTLSRLQLVLWMIVILAGFLVAALRNTTFDASALERAHLASPLSVVVPPQLWLLLGISTTSLVASPLIRGTKMAAPADPQGVPPEAEKERKRTFARLVMQNVPADTIEHQGKIVVWRWPEDARFADLFQGDEVGNAAHLDLGKVQMFFFTLVLVFTYSVALTHAFSEASAPIASLPAVDQGMVALLGISHAGYLSNNAVPHSVS